MLFMAGLDRAINIIRMILQPEHLDDLWQLYQKALPIDSPGMKLLQSFSKDKLRYALFNDRVVFGTWHDGQLINTSTLDRTKIPNLMVYSRWLTDPNCSLHMLKLNCLRETQNYVWDAGCALLKVLKADTMIRTFRLGERYQMGFRPYTILERIMPGQRSRYHWVNDRYFRYELPDEEWWITLAR